MKRLLAIAVAIAAMSILTESNANAQGFAGGYQFGAGINSLNCGGYFRGLRPREQQPYFAMNPPVYYSHIVKRPYGVSPFPAPAGIKPVEMTVAPKAAKITNPFFKGETAPVKTPTKMKTNSNDKMTTIVNPYVGNVAGN